MIDQKSYEKILFCNFSYKSLVDCKPLRIRFNKIDRFITVYDGTRYSVLFESENMILFTIRLDIL